MKVKRLFDYAKELGLMAFFKVISPFVRAINPKYRNLWLISERGNDAGDNGYWLYRYLKENQPKINCAYVITKDSTDFDKVSELGGVIHYRSFKNYLAYYCADFLIGTHIYPASPDLILYYHLGSLGLKARGKQVFLQHGITQADMEWMYYPTLKLDLFVCGSKKEWEYIDKKFNHPDGVVQYLGFCRFDALVAPCETKREIVFMPTWRGSRYPDGEKFKETLYYKTLQSFLDSDKLAHILEQYDCKLIFYPHIEMQKNIGYFHSQSKNVIMGTKGMFDVQTLLKESAMVITDYSSIHFDVGYLEKPLLYYQYDEEIYYQNHYHKGYFDFDNMGFGAVCRTEAELLEQIQGFLENDFKVTEETKRRVQEFFPVRDNKNCERIFKTIQSLR
ncbi:MAG: CDP-glycerol glycerophosphotransferase family protein [Monoglobaceae bacterium]